MYCKPRSVAVGRLQARYQVPVEFDNVELAVAGHQKLGQRALPRANFDQMLIRLRVYRADDPVDNAGILEEVLAEAFSGAMGSVWFIHAGYCSAIIAVNRKPDAQELDQFSSFSPSMRLNALYFWLLTAGVHKILWKLIQRHQ